MPNLIDRATQDTTASTSCCSHSSWPFLSSRCCSTSVLDCASSADWLLAALADEPVGQPVTLANRKKYLDCLFHYFFDCSEQVHIQSLHCILGSRARTYGCCMYSGLFISSNTPLFLWWGTSDLSSFCRGPFFAACAITYRVGNQKGRHIRHQAVYPAVICGQALGMLAHSSLSAVAFAFAALSSTSVPGITVCPKNLQTVSLLYFFKFQDTSGNQSVA